MADTSWAEWHDGEYKEDEYGDRGDYPVDQRDSDAVKVATILTVYALCDIVHEEGPLSQEYKGRKQYENKSRIDNNIHGLDERRLAQYLIKRFKQLLAAAL